MAVSVTAGRSFGVPTGGVFALPFVPWEGGPDYWSRFTKATAAGWTDQSFFPISVFFSKCDPVHVASLMDAGINTWMQCENDPGAGFPYTNITDEGAFVLAQQPFTDYDPANVNVVGYFISDEEDQGASHDGGNEFADLAWQQAIVDTAHGMNDGRFTWANFGNGILRTYWSAQNASGDPLTTMDHFVRMVDGASADKYTYTSDQVASITDNPPDNKSPDWPNDNPPVARAYSYGWQADQMKRFQDPNNLRPAWTFVETARPYLTESTARTIQPDQIEGAVWSALIHEARGIAYFQHNNDATYGGNYSIVEISVVHDKVKAINAKVKSLAAVLNTPSRYTTTRTVNGFTYYEYDFANGTDAMVKTYGRDVYIFASLGFGDATGSKTFTVPSGATGTTVNVVGEGRTLPVTGGTFTDTFDFEYTHHVYQL